VAGESSHARLFAVIIQLSNQDGRAKNQHLWMACIDKVYSHGSIIVSNTAYPDDTREKILWTYHPSPSHSH
jgi:hypothetical protein